jgi:hypothetical protein
VRCFTILTFVVFFLSSLRFMRLALLSSSGAPARSVAPSVSFDGHLCPVARALVLAEQQWWSHCLLAQLELTPQWLCELTASGSLVTAASWHVHSDGRRLRDAPSSSSLAAARGVPTVRW